MSLVAVPDSCVIIPASLRDTIFHAASVQLFRMRLTDDVLNEVEVLDTLQTHVPKFSNLIRNDLNLIPEYSEPIEIDAKVRSQK